MVVYFNNHNADMLPHSINGEITREELKNVLSRDDVLLIPHDTYSLDSGADLQNMPQELFTLLIEMYSRGDCTEYFGNPWNVREVQCEGGYFQDAIKRGARMGVIAASDDYRCKKGLVCEEFSDDDERQIYFKVEADQKVENVTLVKNCRDYIIFKRNEQFLFDYRAENDTDSYYLRIELSDGRFAWTSPIWVNKR